MDVKTQTVEGSLLAPVGDAPDSRQRRALARLGLAAAGAYTAPTLLALRSAVAPPMSGGAVVAA